VGSIEVGKDADFVLLPRDGKFYDFMKDPVLVVIDGKVVSRDEF
jgi:imidazolonepropionase-like amidohydrolase